MIRILQILILGILVFLIIRFVRLLLKYFSSSRKTIDDLKAEKQRFEKEHRDIQEAEYRDLPRDENSESSDKTNA